jgi:S1-C subfamily serine protease
MPIDRGFKGIIEVLKRGEEVEYGFLGVQFDPNVRDGVRLADVIMGSPASRAGLRMGDYLLSVNGKPVRDAEDVFLALGTVLAGSSIEVERSRSPRGPGETLRLTPARYWIPTTGIASKLPPAPGGLRVEWTSIVYQKDRWGRRGISSGVTIREVVKGSPAEKVRLQTGQTILKVDAERVDSPAEFYTVMARKRDQVELTVTALDGKLERVTLKLNGQ